MQGLVYASLMQGLLCDIVGHLFGMCQAENSFIHQHYMVRHAINTMYLLDLHRAGSICYCSLS